MAFLSENLKPLYSMLSTKKCGINYYNQTTGLLNWCDIYSYFHSLDIDDVSYYNLVEKFAYTVQFSEQLCSSLNFLSWHSKVAHLFDWCEYASEICYLQKTIMDYQQEDTLILILRMTNLLERCLGNLFLLKGCHCPNMLKELFETAELKDLIGKECILFLKIFFGPPYSLNVRNVAWHGFICSKEIPWCLCTFIYTLFPSVGHILHERSFKIQRTVRSLFSLNEVCSISENFLKCDDLIDFFMKYFFLNYSYLSDWFNSIRKYIQAKVYDSALILLCPLLEHILRAQFCAANTLPHRLVTAEYGTFFTTFDEMLLFEVEPGSRNALLEKLGDSTFDMLLDIIHYQDGPRIRDHLSHGEIDYLSVNESVVNVFMSVLLSVMSKDMNESCMKEQELQIVMNWSKSYKSIFHPFSLLQQDIRRTAFEIDIPAVEKCLDCKFHPDSLDHLMSVGMDDMVRSLLVAMTNGACLSLQTQVESVCCKNSVSTLGRGSICPLSRKCGEQLQRDFSLLNLTTILQSIVRHDRQILRNLRRFLEDREALISERKLRSRQRENYQRCVTSLIDIIGCVKLVLVLVVVTFEFGIRREDTNVFENRKVIVLKRVAQICENISSLTSSSKNKWNEARECSLKCTDLICSTLA